MARSVWRHVDEGVVEHMSATYEGDARAWIANMIETLNSDDHFIVFVTIWAIWHARRKAINENIFQIPFSMHYFVHNFIADLAYLKKQEKKAILMAVTAVAPCWIPPP
jgi:hypothetical protein